MKKLLYITLFIVLQINVFAQSKGNKPAAVITDYAFRINRLKAENRLVKVSLPTMSVCGGAVDGYYSGGNLVLVNARHYAEFGFSAQKLLIENDTIKRIDYTQHIPEWAKYEQKYPADKFKFDQTKMTYTDTSYIILFTNPITFRKWGKEEKIERKKITLSLQKSINERLACAQDMKNELNKIVQQVDSLRFVRDLPYICGMEFNELANCGDRLYWNVVMLRDNAIELLIDKLDDTTLTVAPVPYFGGNYSVADVAFTALTEIIHTIPTFALLAVPFDEEGCGYCAYWQHLNKNFENRQAFKTAMHKWYHANKYNLEWMESDDFYSCDCKGAHPNGGHFVLINN